MTSTSSSGWRCGGCDVTPGFRVVTWPSRTAQVTVGALNRARRCPIAVGSTVRIAKGVLAQYMALLGDDEGSESLNNLTIVKYSEKHCVVRTEGGTRFAIGTRLLRRV